MHTCIRGIRTHTPTNHMKQPTILDELRKATHIHVNTHIRMHRIGYTKMHRIGYIEAAEYAQVQQQAMNTETQCVHRYDTVIALVL